MSGGVAARRAVVRWALRLFRREWRQQLLVLSLLILAVGAAILGATAAYNIAPSLDGEFGRADYRLELFDGEQQTAAAVRAKSGEGGVAPPSAAMEAKLAEIRAAVPAAEVIQHWNLPIPGATRGVDVRLQDPHGALGRPMLDLRAGRYPSGPGELALTDGAATRLGARVGSTLDAFGQRRTVVGLVENPGRLDDEFALVSHAPRPSYGVTVLVQATSAQISGIDGAGTGRGTFVARTGVGISQIASREGQEDEKATAAAIVLMMAAIVLLLVALVAAAGFVVIAQRRLRQLGMMAAIGATDRHLRLVVLVNGILVGVVAAVVGTVVGLAGWLVLGPRLESAAGHRMATLDVPVWVVAVGMLLAVLTAAAAAWWPARAMARVPITLALSARPPRPARAHRSTLVAVALLAGGFAAVARGIDVKRDHATVWLLIPGVLAIALGVLFVCPLAIRALGSVAARLPVGGRLALRDVARHQGRSSAALAALSLGIGIAVATVVLATAAAPAPDEGNLSARQVLFHLAPDGAIPKWSADRLASARAAIDGYAATLERARVVPLEAAVDVSAPSAVALKKGPAGATESAAEEWPAVMLVRRLPSDGSGATYRLVGRLYVATPDVMAYLGVAAASIAPGTDVLTPHTGALRYINLGRPRPEFPTVTRAAIDVPKYSAAPSSLVTPDALQRQEWTAKPAGWLVESGGRLTAHETDRAREAAVAAGLTMEARDKKTSLATTRTAATVAGVLLALGILAMTVGLIRGEAAADLRTLTATGATGRLRRTLVAATAAALAVLGALLGIAGAYVALIAGFLGELTRLGDVPVANLAVTAVGLPLAAAVAGLLLAGREPPAIARQPLLE